MHGDRRELVTARIDHLAEIGVQIAAHILGKDDPREKIAGRAARVHEAQHRALQRVDIGEPRALLGHQRSRIARTFLL